LIFCSRKDKSRELSREFNNRGYRAIALDGESSFLYIDSQNFHIVFHLYEDRDKIMLTDLIEIHFVELPKFINEDMDLRSNINRWLMFLTDANGEAMEVLKMEDPAIKKAITVLDTLSGDPQTVRLAELRMKHILDEKSMIEGARKEGIEIGEEISKIEIATNFINIGIDDEVISKGTGLSIEEIQKLRKGL
jgi:predicted transposase/invertase (TIGR01784 family)